MRSLQPPTLEAIHTARQRLAGTILHTPLVKFESGSNDFSRSKATATEVATTEIYLKLENLQPTGSFKVRGAGNALLSAGSSQLRDGVWTASAGNMGQALAWYAQKLGIPCTVVVPDNVSPLKKAKIEAFGAQTRVVPFAQYQEIQRQRAFDEMCGALIHPFADAAMMAGNGVIGLELLDALPDLDAVVIPYGGGGLSCGLAAALRAVKPAIKIYAAEVETGAPFAGSFAAGQPVEVPYRHSFVNGIGAPYVFPEMWDLAFGLLDGSIAVSVAQTAEAIRLMALNQHIIVEGAGAVSLAAALTGQAGNGKVACLVSGGNLDLEHLNIILRGEVPIV
ncbi:MAG: threonine ammonia-lyase [Chloroflexota bacterium]